jgi:hypothetical protein
MAIANRGEGGVGGGRGAGGISGGAGRFVNKIYKPTGPTKKQKDEMRHEVRIEQEKISEKQLKEHYRAMFKQWND